MCATCVLSYFSCVQLFVTLWTIAHQSMGFSRQEYWSGLPFPLQGIFLAQGSNSCLLCLLHWQEGSLPLAPAWKPVCRCVYMCCCIVAKLCSTLCNPWTVDRQAPLFTGFPRQEYWSGLPFPSTGYLPDPGINPVSPALAGGFFNSEPSRKPKHMCRCVYVSVYACVCVCIYKYISQVESKVELHASVLQIHIDSLQCYEVLEYPPLTSS